MSFLDRSPRISVGTAEPRPRNTRVGFKALAGLMALGAFSTGFEASAANPSDERAECAKLAEDAQAQRTAGKMRAALESLSMCARESCPVVIRRDCTAWVDEVERVVPTIVVHATDARGQDVASVKVYADGKQIKEQLDGRAIAMDPGVHKLRFVVSGASAVERDVVLAESQKNRLVELRFDRALRLDGTADGDASPTSSAGAPSASSTPVLPWVFMGIGALSLATFGFSKSSATVSTTTSRTPAGRRARARTTSSPPRGPSSWRRRSRSVSDSSESERAASCCSPAQRATSAASWSAQLQPTEAG